ncbi:MAG TPA: hypothetical protein VM120_23255 [Bryobacteraceae bacterium]|nr:hypothetical protein [Bryobacteraceae bacterium]
MRSIKERLEQSVGTLETLGRKRDDMRSPALGVDTEWSLIERELRELEENILQDPGPLDKFLVRIKRGE